MHLNTIPVQNLFASLQKEDPMTRSRCLILLAALTLLWAGVARPQTITNILGPDDNDVRILSSGANSNYHSNDIVSVYDNGPNSLNNVQRSLLQFDLSSIPANQTIAFASLTVYRDSTIWNGGDNGLPTNVYRVTTPWVNTEATWNSASSGVPWTNAGGDYVGTTGMQAMDPYASNMLNINFIGTTGDTGEGGIYPLYFVVTNLVTEWYTGVNPNNGLLMEAPAGNELHFRADRGSNPDLYPRLIIIYHP
jgi:hypothetical protein